TSSAPRPASHLIACILSTRAGPLRRADRWFPAPAAHPSGWLTYTRDIRLVESRRRRLPLTMHVGFPSGRRFPERRPGCCSGREVEQAMSWFDAIVVAAVVGLVVFETRQETGRGLLDTVATLAAAHFSFILAPGATEALGWKPLPGTGISPLAHGILFLGMWGVSLVASRAVHRHTRWTMDHFDPLFGVAFSLVIAATAVDVLAGVTAEQAVLKHGHIPEYLRQSVFADELHRFRSYHYVLSVFHGCQNGQ